MDLHAQQPQSASQRVLQGLRQGAGIAVQLAGVRRTRKICGTGWTANERQATSCSQSHTTPIFQTATCFQLTWTKGWSKSIAAWAASRDRNERLTEIKQIKGQSETHPLLSPNDEFANYELFNYLLGDHQGQIPTIPGSFVRQAYKDGVAMQQARSYNPYKMGIVGGCDSHDTAVPYRQANFFGAHGLNDGNIKERMAGHVFAGLDVRLENPAGLTGIWAEENTRASLFEAMQRKETFATSRPHMKMRFFGGWDYDKGLTDQQNWVKAGYASGVPMGGDLPSARSKAPTFALWAVKDPTSGNLDRIQIIKGWSKSGQSFEKIYDVAWAGNRKPEAFTGKVPPIGSTVDIANATYTNDIGAVELKTVWTDPEFDPSLDAFYYARVLEIPTPRWTTLQAKELGIAPPDIVPAIVQERAWSSPIWYTPNAQAREAAAHQQTVAELKQKGATALDDAQLKSLIVGKSAYLQNNVTGGKFTVTWSSSGLYQINNVDGKIPQPSDTGDLLRGAFLGIPGATRSRTAGSSRHSMTLSLRRRSTSLATNSTRRGATNSATSTTRSSRHNGNSEHKWSFSSAEEVAAGAVRPRVELGSGSRVGSSRHGRRRPALGS